MTAAIARPRRPPPGTLALAAVVLGGAIAPSVVALAAPGGAAAGSTEPIAELPAGGAPPLVLPGPRALVSGLDLECFDTPGPELNLSLQLAQLDPVMLQLGLRRHDVTVRELVQTCVPVQKNGVSPHPTALPFLQHADLACYRIDAAPLATPAPLSLVHLNPVLATLPAHSAALIQPVQLCVTVVKSGSVVAPEVLRLLRWIALECYAVDPGSQPTFGVSLKQLDPALAGLGGHRAALAPSPRQMCVPVQGNNETVPADLLAILRWIELERYTVSPVVIGPPVAAVLGHVHPLLTTLPRVDVMLHQASAVMSSVAMNGELPPPP